MNKSPSRNLKVFMWDYVTGPIDRSEFKEEYRNLFNEVREHCQHQLNKQPRRLTLLKPARILTLVQSKHRAGGHPTTTYHYK